MNKNIFKIMVAGGALALPALAFAANTTLTQLFCNAAGYVGLAMYLIIALGIVVFVWNIYRYFIVADPANKKEAGLYVLYSVVGFFVILSVWGLVFIVQNSLNLPNTQSYSFSILPSTDKCNGGGTTSGFVGSGVNTGTSGTTGGFVGSGVNTGTNYNTSGNAGSDFVH